MSFKESTSRETPTRRSPPIRRRPGPILLTLLLAASPLLASGNRVTPPKDMDPDLLRAVLAIRTGFMSQSTAPLLPLIPDTAKIYLAVSDIASEESYYSSDQIQTLLAAAFSTHRTVEFMVRLDRIREVDEKSQVVLCPAWWTFESHGAQRKVSLRFLLTRQSTDWALKEIRETR
jgi:hypothetical protein